MAAPVTSIPLNGVFAAGERQGGARERGGDAHHGFHPGR